MQRSDARLGAFGMLFPHTNRLETGEKVTSTPRRITSLGNLQIGTATTAARAEEEERDAGGLAGYPLTN